ncbi:MAG: hypothetical protein IJW18_01195 [Lachnospiraceae bacterium]|nr:hypothetical protein [Lachnospiraceae bacterium]
MNNVTNNNTLLSQNEIDTLIKFLTHHEKIQDTVLSQDSIDKLVNLLQNNGDVTAEIFELTDFNSNALESSAINLAGYTLHFTVNKSTQFVVITAESKNGESKKITPIGFSDGDSADDDSEWGYCIEPVVFDKIAATFNLKYSDEEYENVCRTFAMKRYGNEYALIPSIYLPTPEALAKHMAP